MKFIHIADVHLGARPAAGKNNEKRRPEELWESLERIIQECNARKIELLLIAGDLFHRQPLLRELREVRVLFERLDQTQVVFSAGNHDYLKKESYYRTFSWPEHVHMIQSRRLKAVELPEIGACVWGFSYDTKELPVQPPYDRWQVGKEHPCEILMLHGGDERHLPLQKEMLLQLGYDYIALGHIHKPQSVVRDRIVWSGALEPIDKNDTGPHGYVLGEIKDGRCRTEFVPFASREYIHMEVRSEENMSGYEMREKIKAMIEKRGVQNIYQIILKGFRNAGIIYDKSAFDRYGNVIEIVDETKPAYQYEKIMEENRENLLGSFIAQLKDYEKDSVECGAMCEGVKALMETRRG